MSYEIKQVGVEDAAVLALLHAQCFQGGWSEVECASIMASQGVFSWIAIYNTKPVGITMVRAVADESELITFAVMEEHRRQGIGRAMLTTAMIYLANQGIRQMFLEVAEHNHGAIALYKSFGFEQVGKRKGYYAHLYHTVADALTMRAPLNAATQ